MTGKKIVLFFVGWIAFSLLLGHHQAMFKRPQSMHQWAQCDRASVALNYAKDGMDFLKPRVHEVKNVTGITGMEFPLMNYLAAVCYQQFGFNEAWYRFLMFLVVTLGAYCAWRLACELVHGTFYGTFVTIIWVCSPTLNYYTPNFIPDAASMALMMCAWWMLFRAQIYGQRSHLILFFITVTLACLIKITSLIGLFTILALLVLERIPAYRNWQSAFRLRFQGWMWTATLAAIIITFGWYQYAAWLSKKYEATYFLLGMNPAKGIADFFMKTGFIFAMWKNAFYSVPFIVLLFAGVFLLIRKHKKLDARFTTFVLIYALGGLAFYILMIGQFTAHDYYILTLLPVQFFIIVWIARELLAGHLLNHKQLRVTRFIVGLFLAYSIIHTAAHQYLRYDPGNFFSQQVFPPKKYEEVGKLAHSLGITREHIVFTMFDNSPNVSLYYMDLKGWSFNVKHTPEHIDWALNKSDRPAQYLITNDTAAFSVPALAPYRASLLGETQGVGIYRLDKTTVKN